MSKALHAADIHVVNLTIPKLEASKKTPAYCSSTPTYNGKTLFITTHEVFFPFGISPPNLEKKIKKWSLPISEKTNGIITPQNQELFSMHDQLDDHLMKHLMENPKYNFGHETVKSLDVYEGNLNRTAKSDKEHPEKTEQYGRRIAPIIMTDEKTGHFQEFQTMIKNPEYNSKTNKDVPKYLPIDPMSIVPRSMGYVTYKLQSSYIFGKRAFGYTWVVSSVVVTRFGADPAPEPAIDSDEEEMDNALATMEMPTNGNKREREEEMEEQAPPEPNIEEEPEPTPKKSKTVKIAKKK